MDAELVKRLKDRLKESEQALAEAQIGRNGFRNELRKAEDKLTQAQVMVDTVKNMIISALEK